MKILVTGGLGYIGSHTVVKLIENKDEVAIKELEGQNLIVVDVLSMMMKYETHFKDYSMEEENFLPEYILKI